MGGQKFEYDESGSTFFYFVLSFLALILVPATFYYWPRKRKEGKKNQIKSCGLINFCKDISYNNIVINIQSLIYTATTV